MKAIAYCLDNVLTSRTTRTENNIKHSQIMFIDYCS